MRSRRIPLQAASLLVSGGIVMASTIPANDLFRRGDASQCPVAGFDSCPQNAANHWPDNFCCPTGSSCLSLAGNTTLLCCPADSNCSAITPMGCQIDLYNADLHPDAMVKTTVLNGILGHCGTGTCCPFGYSCGVDSSGAAACFLNSNQNPRPLTPLTTTSADPSSTTVGSSSPGSTVGSSSAPMTGAHTAQGGGGVQVSPTSPPAGASTPGQSNGASSGADTAATESTNSGTPTAVIAGACVGAALLVAAVAVVAFVFSKRRHSRKQEEEAADALKLTRSTSSFGNIISNPIVAENSTMRTDFVRKSPGGRSSVVSGLSVSTLVDDEGLHVTPSAAPARVRDGVGGGAAAAAAAAARIPPIRNMAQARQSSIAYGVGAPDTSPYSGGNYHAVGAHQHYQPYPPVTPPRQQHGGPGGQEREPSSISISVFADPRIATPQQRGGDGGLLPETPDMRRHSHLTTFSDMLRSADLGGVADGEPYVSGSSQAGTPASKRR